MRVFSSSILPANVLNYDKHLWPLSNRLFCQNCCTLLSYSFIFTAFTIILCSPKTTWRPFPLVLYLPSGTSKIFRLIGCALCSSFLHAKDLPTTNAAALLTYLIRNHLADVFKTALHVGQNKENKFPMRSSICQYSNRTWATTNHSARVSTTLSNTQQKHAQTNCRTCEGQIHLGAENL